VVSTRTRDPIRFGLFGAAAFVVLFELQFGGLGPTDTISDDPLFSSCLARRGVYTQVCQG
jgi:hypothetical protein